ncbi:MAG: hypothetical protein HYW86_04570 [Candidatus Roizmanbacteria bacterium]|nr:MAG: hypothetical protein HYW86_04570 [Candidatus Roizmanbacteria bacterium]
MIKKGILITIIFVISTFIQLLSQIIITRIFGAKLDIDIFLAAVAIPTIAVTVIYGTLNDAFLPLYGEKKASNPEKSDEYFISSLITLGTISFVIAWIFSFFTNPISAFLYGNRGEEFVKNVAVQMSYMSFSLPLSVIATLLGAYYYTHKKFSRFPFAQLIGSLTNLLLIVILAPYLGIFSLVIAFVINIFFQIILVIPKAIINFKFKLVNVLPLFIAWIPLIIGNFALRSDILLMRSFASNLPEGYFVYLNLVSKIFALSTSVMTIGIQVLLLPHLVDYFSQKLHEKAIANVAKAKIIAVFISIIVTILLILLAPLAINILFVGGKFSQEDARITISLLPLFVLPAIGWGVNAVFFQPLLALRKQYQLGLINIFALFISWTSAWFINKYLGPLPAITWGLIILLFTGIIGSEILWHYYKKKLLS